MSTRKESYEFGGRIGNTLMILGLPILVYYFYFCLRFGGGDLVPLNVTRETLAAFGRSIRPTWTALGMYGVWLGFQALLQAAVPGRKVFGRETPDGIRLEYRLNGLASFLITLGVFAGLVIAGVPIHRLIFDNLGAVITVAIIIIFGASIFLHIYGRATSPGGPPSDSVIHNFFMGYALNPRIAGFDLKLFFEARPSLIGWIVIILSYALVQRGEYGFVSLAMVLSCGFQFVYVLDYFIHEEAILSTMDIVHDRFGFMLCFGDSVWVPFTYSIQAYYLIDHVHRLPIWAAVVFSIVFAAGYVFFRVTNLQKHRFREDSERPIRGRKPEYIETPGGNKLLVSGFWGWSRHFNYVGDILMATAWSLPCLFGSLLPYFYPIYFTILLIHRERRDYHRCAKKYGEAWEKYCRRVPWRILPGIY